MRVRMRPAPERRVRREDGTLLPDGGLSLLKTPYWDRLIKAGDVVTDAVEAIAEAVEVDDKKSHKSTK